MLAFPLIENSLITTIPASYTTSSIISLNLSYPGVRTSTPELNISRQPAYIRDSGKGRRYAKETRQAEAEYQHPRRELCRKRRGETFSENSSKIRREGIMHNVSKQGTSCVNRCTQQCQSIILCVPSENFFTNGRVESPPEQLQCLNIYSLWRNQADQDVKLRWVIITVR
jgi:hypothetical protein